MLESAGDPRLLDESGETARVAHDLGRQDLQRDRPAERGIARAVDEAHPALADQGFDPVLAKRGADEIGARVQGDHRYR